MIYQLVTWNDRSDLKTYTSNSWDTLLEIRIMFHNLDFYDYWVASSWNSNDWVKL